MIETLYNHYLASKKISTDTRKIEPGSIFFALKGPNFNANEFAKEALDKGAALAVIDEAKYNLNDRYILVDDVLEALQNLAIHHRKKLTIPIIGLTGSNGKTTTKELINAVLSKKYNVLATQGNLNNHIGVPLTILSITNDHEMAIIEMGANHVGEIAALSRIAHPTHGLITNIGKAHLEGFGGIEGVIRGKSELYHHLIQTVGVVWINSRDEILSNMAKRFKNPLFYPGDEDYYSCELVEASPFVKVKTTNQTIETQLVGKYNFENIAVALCIGKYFEVPSAEAEEAVMNYNPTNNRSQIVKKGSNTIILDAYNANPNSMASAIENLKIMAGDQKAVILGDMKELGESSTQEHLNIINILSQEDFNVYLYGPEFGKALSKSGAIFHTDNKKELLEKIRSRNFKDSSILIKGSRSMGLEEVVEVIS
ncbi:UDP-N-acetylmuramoyl-tripeptide--D-alanyl-D-alanine ligase [Fulvivirga sp. RKSG066]|uniref:UDP-N-acetylmuramoyl-tripeptide--D-alanyl-D- alanine ligase n=1 Tax=Fulvivirga aurantia TaxID=2529383 RepID=UPI0012BBE6D5|nr:UDP-N-acetylmuramoyl-tripeptide--D-alanyl-D-alanine ligase [Fulvivirga aurantia]MTI21606.1 UDP-N-acetylmuramoyl-tripeptide--D-alanyl-D-alanine ligase [Fulvivirga aurantia]